MVSLLSGTASIMGMVTKVTLPIPTDQLVFFLCNTLFSICLTSCMGPFLFYCDFMSFEICSMLLSSAGVLALLVSHPAFQIISLA